MLTLYTAVGSCRLMKKASGDTYPVVFLGNQELHLDAHEMLLWSSLAFTILTHQEARALFYEKEAELHILSDLDFEHYLKRLVFRGLVASGSDYTGVNALYKLLEPLYIRAAKASPCARIASSIHMILFQHFPLKAVWRILQTEKLSDKERAMLRREKLESLPICKLLKTENTGDHEEITTLANLYFKKQILFDSL